MEGTTTCPACGRTTGTRRATCIYCGAVLPGVEVRGPATGPVAGGLPPAELGAVEPGGRRADVAGRGLAALLSAGLSGVGGVLANRCPECGGPPGDRPLRIEAWEDTTGLWDTIRSRRRWTIRTTSSPGPCARCTPSFLVRRVAAGVLGLLPLGVVFFGGAIGAVVGALYAFYLLKWGGYTWADGLVYGLSLRVKLAERCPPGRVRFPVGLLHWAARMLAALVLVTVAWTAGAWWRSRPVGGDARPAVERPVVPASSGETRIAWAHVAAAAGDLARVRELVTAEPALLRSTHTPQQLGLLHQAVKPRSPAVLSWLLGRGAPVDQVTRDGSTALHWAAAQGRADMVALLLAHGASARARNLRSQTPLHSAAFGGHTGIALSLLRHGADPAARQADGATAADIARQRGRESFVTAVSAFRPR